MNRYVCVASLGTLLCSAACAQHAAKFMFPSMVFTYRDAPEQMLGVGAGYEYCFENGLASGIEFSLPFRSVGLGGVLEYEDQSVSVEGKCSAFAMIYHTSFALTGDEGSGLYLGTSIGWVRAHGSIEVERMIGWYSDPTTWQPRYEATRNMMPVGLRIGLRWANMALLEMNLGWSYTVGGDKHLFEEPQLADVHARTGKNLWTFNCAFGGIFGD